MAFDYNGKWKNQLEAMMSIVVNAEDCSVTGTFTNALDEAGPLTGFVRGDIIVFSCGFEKTVGTMLGQPLGANDPSSFATWWHFRLLDDSAADWATVRTGCDTFTRIG